MNKKLIALAIAGLASGIHIPDGASIRRTSYDYSGPEPYQPNFKEANGKSPRRHTGTAAAKRAAKKKRNRK